MTSLMLQSVYAEGDGKKLVLVDLGYWSDAATRARYETLRAAKVPRSRFSLEGHGRLLLAPAPTKAAALLAQYPIVEGSTYWRTTHHWVGLGETPPHSLQGQG